jgi:dCMP deaminase
MFSNIIKKKLDPLFNKKQFKKRNLNFDCDKQELKPTWDTYYMNILENIKLRSPDYIKVGAIIVSMKDNRIISTGYNSIKAGINEQNIDWNNRTFIHNIMIHAEMNALLYSQSRFEDAILYVSRSPCIECLKLLSATQIKKIIYKDEHKDIIKVKNIAEFLQIELIKFHQT